MWLFPQREWLILDKGEIFYAGPQIPNYAGTQFKKEIEGSFGIPCEIENDVNCAGLAEVTTRPMQKDRTMLFA